VGVFRKGEWYLDNCNLQWDGCGEFPTRDLCGAFGLPNDMPIVGRWFAFPRPTSPLEVPTNANQQ
jgi:hypothetical protein